MSENAKYEVKEGKFSLNKSTIQREENGKSYPDWFGETLINGVKYKIAGWSSTSQAGNKYLSCTIQEKVEIEAKETTTDNSKDLF